MKNPNQPTKTTDPVRNPFNRSPWWRAFLVLATAFAVACFALSPPARAVCQEGCLTNNNTVLGDDALLSNTTGNSNTVIGFQALINNTSGFGNTATGWQALFFNTTGAFNTATGVVALQDNTTGNANTATGYSALKDNTPAPQVVANKP